MRERIEMVGGRFLVKSQPGKGTNVRVTIPQAGTKHSKRKKIKL
jgi:signal transduction histidine kinase